MPDDQDELVAPAPQAAAASPSGGDELVQAAPQQKGFFGKLWDAGIQSKIQDTLMFNAASKASDRAIDEWVHGRFSGSGAKAAQDFNYYLNPHPTAAPEVTHGFLGAINTGFQGSATGLALRGALPSVTLDQNGAKWWEKTLAGGTQLVSDLPEMVAGGVAGAPGGPMGVGAAAFATPTAIREALVTAYSTNQATSVADFTNRTALAFQHTAQDAELGGLTAGAGEMMKPFAAAIPGAGATARFASKALVPSTELATMATAGPLLQGRLPEKEDFINGAFMIGGLHLARGVAEGLGNIYEKTGIPPRQVLADAQVDPTIAEDLRANAGEALQAKAEAPEPETKSFGEIPPAVQGDLHTARQSDTVNRLAVESGLDPDHWRPFDPKLESQADFVQNRVLDAEDHPEAFQKLYASIPETRGGKIINGDVAEMLAVGNADPKQGLEGIEPHAEEAFNIRVFRKMWADKLAQLPEGAKVWVMAGGPGAGKSRVSQELVDEGHADLIFDGNGHTTGRLEAPVQDALKANADVNVGLVTREHGEAVSAMESRALTELRRLNPNGMAETALAAAKHVQAFSETPNGQKVRVWVIDNKTNQVPELSGFEPGSPNLKPGLESTVQKAETAVEALRGQNEPETGQNAPAGSPAVGAESGTGTGADRAAAGGVGPGSRGSAVPRAYQSVADAQAVQDAVPGLKAIPGLAESVAQELFTHPDVKIPGEPSPLQVNYKYLNTSDQVNGALARMSQLNETAIQEQRRGTVTWDQTEAEAGSYLASLLGQTEPVQARQPGTAAGAAELLARKQLVRGAALDMKAQAKAMVDAGTNASPDQVMEFLNSINRSAMIQAEFLGARAEAGRALNILKDTKVTAERAELIQDLISQFKQDPLKLAQMLEQTESPEGASAFARDATKSTTWAKVIEAWKAGLLGPLAVTKKALSDGVMMVSRPLVDAIAYAPSQFSVDPAERMSAAEPLARIIGNVQGASEGLTQAWNEIKLESMGGVTENRAAIPGMTGEIIRTPFRLLKAVTVLAKAMQERGEANALAARQASFEGYNPATSEFVEKVAQYSAHPSLEAAEQIDKFGNRMVFNAPLNPPGKAFQKFINTPIEGNIAPLQIVFPFTKVPLNVFDEQTRLSPLAFLSKDWRTDFNAGGAERAKAAAEVVVGMGLTGLGLAWAASGQISGAGDPDPNKRRIAMAAGWQPYSLKLGNTWYSMKNIHPVGTLLGLSADVHEMSQFMTEGESDRAVRTLGQAFAHSVTEQTMLQGMTMVVEALNSPERGVQHLAQGYAGSVVPATVAQTASTMDPYMREVNSIRDAIQARIPGARESLMPKRDPYGEPIPNPERLGVTLPITESPVSEDKVRTEAARLGVGVAKAPQAVNIPSRGLLHGQDVKVELTPEQRDTFGSTAGKMAYSIMSPLVNSPNWDQTPDILKAKIYSVAFEKANKIGNMAALSQAQRQQEMQRVTDEISAKLRAPVSP